MRIGLDPNRWNRPPRKKTLFDRYFGCLMLLAPLTFVVVILLVLFW